MVPASSITPAIRAENARKLHAHMAASQGGGRSSHGSSRNSSGGRKLDPEGDNRTVNSIGNTVGTGIAPSTATHRSSETMRSNTNAQMVNRVVNSLMGVQEDGSGKNNSNNNNNAQHRIQHQNQRGRGKHKAQSFRESKSSTSTTMNNGTSTKQQ